MPDAPRNSSWTQLQAIKHHLDNNFVNPVFAPESHAWFPDDPANYMEVGSYDYVGMATILNSVALQVRAVVRPVQAVVCKLAFSVLQCSHAAHGMGRQGLCSASDI